MDTWLEHRSIVASQLGSTDRRQLDVMAALISPSSKLISIKN